MKKFLSILLAAMMVLATAGVAFAEEETATTYTITYPTSGINTDHTYEIYQIFVGDLAIDANNNSILSNVVWGEDAATGYTEGEKVSDEILTTLKNASGSDQEKLNVIKNYVNLDGDPAYTLTAEVDEVVVPAGYYLIKDKNGSQDNEHDAYTTYIVQVLNDLAIAPKAVYPTVDKEVKDETGDAEVDATDGWGESADHAINESFDFRLIATLPTSAKYADYETYKVTFVDTMSSGITFEQIDSVTVDGVTVNAQELNEDGTVKTAGYVCNATAGQAGGSWELEIADLKTIAGVDLIDGAEIVVVYSAHLNENAQVDNASVDATANENTVKLQYSNNPNAAGEGETPEDSVWVFSYVVNNTKYANSVADANKMAGAGFTLYNGAVAIKLIEKADGTYIVADQSVELEADTENAGKYKAANNDADNNVYVYEMTSSESSTNKGQFNIKGLDAGTYTLKETKVPEGYNKLDDKTIIIAATHVENEEKTNATMTLETESTMNNDIINKSGATLPETGGIGTTLFYLIGGLMAAGSALTLVIRRRADADEE